MLAMLVSWSNSEVRVRLQFTIAAWRSIGILGLIAVHACGDNQLIAPKTSNVARISAAVVDQSAAPSATHITLHGRRGIVHEFTLIGNVVYFAGHGSGVLSAEAADKLRAAGIEDAKLTKLVEKAEPVWAARGLNIDADTGTYAHGSSL